MEKEIQLLQEDMKSAIQDCVNTLRMEVLSMVSSFYQKCGKVKCDLVDLAPDQNLLTYEISYEEDNSAPFIAYDSYY